MHFEIMDPIDWHYAKFTITNKDTQKSETVSITPKKNDGIFGIVDGEYWIEANIRTESQTINAYQTIYIQSGIDKENSSFESSFELPEKPIIIVMAIIAIVGIIGVIIRKY